MPKDHWARARAKDAGRQATKLRGEKRRQAVKGWRSWYAAIKQSKSHVELTAIATSLAVMHKAGKITDDRFTRLVQAGKQQRLTLSH